MKSPTGNHAERWTTSDGKNSSSPNLLTPPKGQYFSSDWKIDVSGHSRDKLGWEYFHNRRRRRRWLRPLSPIPPPPLVSTLDEEERARERRKVAAKARRGVQQRLSIMSILRDNYNFKGFGLSCYKSFIFPKSFGAMFRLPLTANLDMLERRPYLPSISSSAGFFYPWTLACFISVSLPVEVIRYAVLKLLFWLSCLWDIMTTPLRKNGPRKERRNNITWMPSSDVQERMGVSVSWRVSQKRGYEFRISYWHLYLPTIEYLLGKTAISFLKRTKDVDMWLRQHTGSLGLSNSGPIPDYPHLSCSAVLSMSGLYWKDKWALLNFLRMVHESKRRQIREEVAMVEVETSAAPASVEGEGEEGVTSAFGNYTEIAVKKGKSFSA